MSAIFALVAFIAVIIIWNVVFKRNIGESMFIGFIVSALFAGADFFPVLLQGFLDGIQNEVTFAALAFVIVGEVLTAGGVIQRIIGILSSMIGRVRGGSIYAGTLGSAVFGAVAHNGAATAATVGAITIPWIKRSNASGETAAVVLGGNAGVGSVFPFSGAFFLLLAAPTVIPDLTAEQMILPMFVAALWFVLLRMGAAFILIRRRKVSAMEADDINPLADTFRAGWSSLLVLAAIAIPILATTGPTGDWVMQRVGADAFDAIPVLFWLPFALLIPGLFVGRKNLPRSAAGWWRMISAITPKLALVSMTMVSAFSASEVLNTLGLGEQLAPLLAQLSGVPVFLVVLIIGVIMIVVSGPLSTTATLAAVGAVAYGALTAVGIPPIYAFGALIIWAASESASPPGAAPLYVAAGIAEVNPVKTFFPVITYYLIPTFVLGVLMAMGLAWLPGA